MSTLQHSHPIEPAGEADELAQFIAATEKMLRSARGDLRKAKLAAAAQRIRNAAPEAATVIIAVRPFESEPHLVNALTADGQPLARKSLAGAAEVVRGLDPSQFRHPAGSRVDIAAAAAWWKGN